MKKEASGKKGKWLWLALGIVAILAVAGVVLALVLGGNGDQARGGRPVLYWNVDKTASVDPNTGLSLRKPAEDGNYYVRFACDGEQLELPVADKRLVNYIDSLDLMGLKLDNDGYIVDIYAPEDIANVVGEALYVQSVNGDTIIANSSIMMNGKKVTIKLTEEVDIYNVSGSGEFVGEEVEASALEPMDTIGVYGTWIAEDSEEESVTTHVYLVNKPQQSPVYFRGDRFYNSTTKSTTRKPDENGDYTIKFYVDGETVELKCKDQALVTAIDKQDKHWAHFGLVFDEEGYIIKIIDSALATRSLIQCERFDITEIDDEGNYVATSLIKNNGSFVQGTVGSDCVIYDVSSAAKSEGQDNRKVDKLQLGDRVCIWTDTAGKPVLIYVTCRRVDVPTFWNCTRSYNSTTKQTSRTPNANGYYEIELLPAGETKKTKYYTKDIEIATAIDVLDDRVAGLVIGEGNIIECVYDIEAVFGHTYLSRGWFVIDSQATVAIFQSTTGSGSTKNGILAADAKVYNVSQMGQYGAETTLQYGDRTYVGRIPTGEIAYAYVTQRYLGRDALYGRLSTRAYDTTKKETTRTPDAEGYYVYEFVHKGKVVTLKTKDKAIANTLDSQTAPGYALKVNGDIITEAYLGEYAMGGARNHGYYVQSLGNDTVTLVNSAGTVVTRDLPKDYEAYIVCDVYEQYKGEKTTLRIGDYVTAYRGMGNDVPVIYIRGRETSKAAWPVSRQTANDRTTRKPDANGWYYMELAIDGKVSTYKTKYEAIATRVDSYGGAFGVNLKGDVIVSVSGISYVKNVQGAGVTDQTVTAVKGNQITTTYTLGHSTKTGTTQSFSVSGAKIYDVSAAAGDKFGTPVKLQVGDKIRTYVDADGNVLYVYVTAHCTREGGYMSYCEHCDKVVYWNAYIDVANIAAYDTHYYLPSDVTITKQLRIYSTERDFETVLDLNGYTLFREGGRAIRVHYGDTLTIMDSSAEKTGMIRTRNSTEQGAVMVYGNKTDGTGVVNMLSGIITMDSDEGVTAYPRLAGLVGIDKGIFNMKGGELRNGVVKARNNDSNTYGAAVWNSSGEFNMSGGKITGGRAYGHEYTTAEGKTTYNSARGANIYSTGNAAKVTISGGVVENGIAGRGGNIYINGGELHITGGTVQNGIAAVKLEDGTQISYSEDGRGGNIFNGGAMYISGGTVSGGVTLNGSSRGGNIYATGASDLVDVSGKAVITNGKAKNGNNIYLMYCNLTVSGGTISDGEVTSGEAIYTSGTADSGYSTVTISGGTVEGTVKIAGGTEEGGNYPDYRSVLYLAGGNVKDVLDATGAQAIHVSGKPVVNLLKNGSNLLNVGKMENGASVTVDAVGVFTKPVNNAAAYTGYFNTTTEGYLIGVTADNALKIYHPDAVAGHCEHCDTEVEWMPWNGGSLANGHYFLADNVQLTGEVEVATGVAAVIDLNGHTVTAAENKYCFNVNYGDLTVLDSSADETGVITGGRAKRGGNIYVYHGTFTLLSGTITGGVADNSLGGSTDGRGGNIYALAGTVNLLGGTVSNGIATTGSGYGGNIFATYYSELNISGDAVITKGEAVSGGNIYLSATDMVMDGGVISKGSASKTAANLYVTGADDTRGSTVAIHGGAITNGSIYLTGGVKAATEDSAAVDYRTKLEISGGNLDCIVGAAYMADTVKITGNPVIRELRLSNGALLYAEEMTEGASVTVSTTGVISLPYADKAAAEALIANEYIVAFKATDEVTLNESNELVVGPRPFDGTNGEFYCQACQGPVNFLAWNGEEIAESGHYFLENDITLQAQTVITAGLDVVIELNGHTITGTQGNRTFSVYGKLTIQDSSAEGTGMIIGSTAAQNGANIVVQKNGEFNMYSGTITGGHADGKYGGNLYITGDANNLAVVNIYGGKIVDGKATRGGNIYINYGAVTISGDAQILNGYGEYTSGTTGRAGNIYVTNRASSLTITDDVVISGGKAGKDGGNIYSMYANVTISGNAVIKDGVDLDGGLSDNMYISGTDEKSTILTITGGEITNGEVYVTTSDGTDIEVLISGAPVISELKLGDGKVISVGALTGGSIKVNAAGVVTAPFADANAAAAALAYIDTVAHDKILVVNADNALEIAEACPCGCKTLAADVEWQDANAYMAAMKQKASDNHRFEEDVHLRLTADLDITEIYGESKQIVVGEDSNKVKVVIDLNGYTWSSQQRMNNYGTLTLLDSSEAGTGTMTCPGRNLATAGGVLYNQGILNIYSGTYTQPAGGSNVNKGGVISTKGTVNMYGGTITGGQALPNGDAAGLGGNVYISAGEFNLYGGTITGGTAAQGADVYMLDGATLNVAGGIINGDVYVPSKLAIVNVSGAAQIGNLILDTDAVVTPGAMQNGASVGITKNTAFTDVLENAENYAPYFHSADGTKTADVDADGKLILAILEKCICGCGASADDVEWQDAQTYMEALSGKSSDPHRFVENVHLRLNSDINITEIYGEAKQITVGKSSNPVKVTIDLNGYTWYSDYRMYNYGTLTLLDSSEAGTGTMIGPGRNLATVGGVLYNEGTLNIYSGTYTQPADGSLVSKGGVVASKGTVNMYGGTITGGQALPNGDAAGLGGNVYISGGTFTMYDGTITGGSADEGSNVYILAAGTFNHEGGTIEDKDNTVVKAE